MSLRFAFQKLTRRRKRKPTLEAAEKLLLSGRKADAASQYRELAEDGSITAQLRLGQFYERGEGVLQNFLEAVRWYRAAAEQFSKPAIARLGEIYLTGLSAPNTATPAALACLEEDDNPDSLLKRLYPLGLGVAADPEEAARWNSKAAKSGDAGGQARLGHQYATGNGVGKDFSEALRWFQAAASQELEAGLLGVGMLFAGAYGIEAQNHIAARDWLERAVSKGNKTAKLSLALLLLFGEGVEHDSARAATLLQEAAEANLPTAMFHLGELYRRGVGLEQSNSMAETWLRRAAARGYQRARLSLVYLFRTGSSLTITRQP